MQIINKQIILIPVKDEEMTARVKKQEITTKLNAEIKYINDQVYITFHDFFKLTFF